jgi:hypothetical protein
MFREVALGIMVTLLLVNGSSAFEATSRWVEENVVVQQKSLGGNGFPSNGVSNQYSQSAFSDPPEVRWNETYGGADSDMARSVVQTADGGYVIVGYTWSFGAGNVDAWMVKTDVSGNILWNETFGGTAADYAYSVEQTSDGGYAIAGNTNSFGAGSNDFWLVKTDSVGNMQWNRTYGGIYDDRACCVAQTIDGGYVLAGCTQSFGAGNYDIWLVKTDGSGNIQWSRTYGGSSHDWAWSAVQTSDDGYAIAGRTQSFGAGSSDYWLVKTDASGAIQWNRTYGGTNWDEAYCTIQTSDGGYAVGGSTGSFGAGAYDFWLVKTDTAGNMQWNETYGGTASEYAFSIAETEDGGYAVAGDTASFGAGGIDCWLVKTDPYGSAQWNKTVGRSNSDIAYSMIQTGDRGFGIAGCTWSFGAGNSDFWLIKLASEFPDVRLAYVGVSKNVVGYGYAVDITEAVENLGETEQVFDLATYYNSRAMRTQTLTMAARSNITTTFSWTPSGDDEGENLVWAATPWDSCTGTRIFVSIPGDVNADRKVDLKDVYACGKAFGSIPSHPRWSPNCDINNDGKVDLKDYYKTCQAYGRFWSLPFNALSVYATSPHMADGSDASTVTVTAKDEYGSPVPGANIIVLARTGIDGETILPVEEKGNGTYVTHFVTFASGNYTLTAYDCFWNRNNTIVTFLCKPTTRIRLAAEYDFSQAEPRAIIRAYATDAYGNIAEDANITFTTDLGTIVSICEEPPGLYTATLVPHDWETATITAIDITSGLTNSLQVEFFAGYLDVPKGAPLGVNFTVPVYVYAPSKNGYLFTYNMSIFFNSTIVTLLDVKDGNLTDGFATPIVDVIDNDTIRIHQTNQLATADENVPVANLIFTTFLEENCIIGIKPPHIYLQTIREGLPEIWLQDNPPPKENKGKETVTYTATIWRIKKKDGTRIPTDEQINKRIEFYENLYKKLADDCFLPFLIKISYKIKEIDWDEWKGKIDKSGDPKRPGFDDGKLDAGEREAMHGSEEWVDADVDINIYLGFDLKDTNGESIEDVIEDGVTVRKGRVFVNEVAEHDYHKYVLAHEVLHKLSKNKILDSYAGRGMKKEEAKKAQEEAQRQGAKEAENLFNASDFCTKECKIGPKLTKQQGDLIEKPKKP